MKTARLLVSSSVAIATLLAFAPAFAKKHKRDQPLPPEQMNRLASEQTFIVFDWDDNVFKLPTKNALFLKGEFATLADPRLFLISSTEFSQHKSEVGQPGTPLERFEIIHDNIDPMNGTFRFSRPGKNGRNYMHEDMSIAVRPDGEVVKKIPEHFKAPFFELYIQREANPRTRQANRILTGRGQRPEEFYAAMELLAKVPEIRATGYQPTDVSRLTLVGGKGPAHELKAVDLINRLAEAEAKGFTLFAFPDDDPANIRRAAETLLPIPHSIDVWLIWTRENAPSVLVDLAEVKSQRASGSSLKEILDRAFASPNADTARSSHGDSHSERERLALICRSMFF